MHYDGIIYRPPFEARSLLLQVTSGCSHNSCSFCTMYKDIQYKESTMEEVEEDLQEASVYKQYITRVFLENGDAFTLPGEKLIHIAERINAYLPNVQTITMYANINNIKDKTDEELKRMAELGIDDLNIGLESGDDEALTYMNKGYNAEEALEQLERLNRAGIHYGLNIIFGILGTGKSLGAMKKTAELINKVQPRLIFTGTIHAEQGCNLYDDMQSGAFTECTVREYIEEQKLVLNMLNLENTIWFGLHPANIIPTQGYLPQDKEKILAHIEAEAAKISESVLDRAPMRKGGEGAAIL